MDDLAKRLQKAIEADLYSTMTSNVAPENAEPMTLEKIKAAVMSLPERRPDIFGLDRFPTMTLRDLEPEPAPLFRPFYYGMAIMKPRPVVVFDLGPTWKRVACLARGGRKRRRKVMRRVLA